ncbi:hypothetical protein AAY473_022454 [Plecturocebus cupreus]
MAATYSPGPPYCSGTELWLEAMNPQNAAGLMEATPGSSGGSRPRKRLANANKRKNLNARTTPGSWGSFSSCSKAQFKAQREGSLGLTNALPPQMPSLVLSFLTLQCWDYRREPPYPAIFMLLKTYRQGRAQWLTPVIPALWETEMGGSPEPDQHGETLSLLKIQKISWLWWRAPIIRATLEAEAGESLEPGRQRLRFKHNTRGPTIAKNNQSVLAMDPSPTSGAEVFLSMLDAK